MVDQRFFTNAGSLSLREIAALTGATVSKAAGEWEPVQVSDVAPLDRAGASDISFLDNTKYLDAFAASRAGACFVRPAYVARAPSTMIALITDEPYYAYALTAGRFYPPAKTQAAISAAASIAKSARLGKNIRIDAHCVIGENVQIGDHCHIGAGVVIDDGVIIGEHCRIGALCTLSHAIIGKRVTLHRGIHIGQDGFGFAPSPTGIAKVPQLGRVMIEDDVEIGSGTCIDRGAGPDTVIGAGSKIDNLVQIGHNVQIGKYVIIAAQCGISGSTHIESGAMLGGQVGISGHIRIGAGAKIAAQSGIMSDIPAKSTYGGYPAVAIKDWHRQTIAIEKLIKKKIAT